MIEFSKEPLPIPFERNLRSWLAKSECNLLRRVVTARCQFKQAEALQAAASSDRPQDSFDLLAQSAMRDSLRFKTFLDVLNEIANQSHDERFFTAKLKPTHSYGNSDSGTEGSAGSAEED